MARRQGIHLVIESPAIFHRYLKYINTASINSQQTICSTHLVSPRGDSHISLQLRDIKIFFISYQEMCLSHEPVTFVAVVFVAIFSGHMSIVRQPRGIDDDKSRYFQTDVNTV